MDFASNSEALDRVKVGETTEERLRQHVMKHSAFSVWKLGDHAKICQTHRADVGWASCGDGEIPEVLATVI